MKKVRIMESEWIEVDNSILCIAETLDGASLETAFSLTPSSFGLDNNITERQKGLLKEIAELLPGKVINLEIEL